MDLSADYPPKWNTEVMRECRENWNLSNDVDLLKYIENFSKEIISKARCTLQSLDSFASDVHGTSVEIRTVFNQFQSLADTQFVENRVFEEEADLSNETKVMSNLYDANKHYEETNNKEREAILHCIHVIDEKFETVQLSGSDSEDESHLTSQCILKPINKYQDRPLPHLIGSKEFMADDMLGLVCLSSEDSENDEASVDNDWTPNDIEEVQDTEHFKDGRNILSRSARLSSDMQMSSSTSNTAAPDEDGFRVDHFTERIFAKGEEDIFGNAHQVNSDKNILVPDEIQDSRPTGIFNEVSEQVDIFSDKTVRSNLDNLFASNSETGANEARSNDYVDEPSGMDEIKTTNKNPKLIKPEEILSVRKKIISSHKEDLFFTEENDLFTSEGKETRISNKILKALDNEILPDETLSSGNLVEEVSNKNEVKTSGEENSSTIEIKNNTHSLPNIDTLDSCSFLESSNIFVKSVDLFSDLDLPKSIHGRLNLFSEDEDDEDIFLSVGNKNSQMAFKEKNSTTDLFKISPLHASMIKELTYPNEKSSILMSYEEECNKIDDTTHFSTYQSDRLSKEKKSQEDIDEKKEELKNTEVLSNVFKSNSQDIQIVKTKGMVSSDNDVLLPSVNTETLLSLCKGRIKIQSKRRLPTRKKTVSSKNPEVRYVEEDVPKSNAILSPVTDEEDLFVLPPLDFPKEKSSNDLFSGSILLSPGQSIDSKKGTNEFNSKEPIKKLDIKYSSSNIPRNLENYSFEVSQKKGSLFKTNEDDDLFKKTNSNESINTLFAKYNPGKNPLNEDFEDDDEDDLFSRTTLYSSNLPSLKKHKQLSAVGSGISLDAPKKDNTFSHKLSSTSKNSFSNVMDVSSDSDDIFECSKHNQGEQLFNTSSTLGQQNVLFSDKLVSSESQPNWFTKHPKRLNQLKGKKVINDPLMITADYQSEEDEE